MSSSASLQLAANENSQQGKFLTLNPQITHFKYQHRRHSDFAIDVIPQSWISSGPVIGKSTSSSTCSISKQGDLINQIFIQIKLPSLKNGVKKEQFWKDYLGLRMIDSIELTIGSNKIDTITGQQMYVMYQLAEENMNGFERMVGKTVTSETEYLYVPLRFWFTEFDGCQMPLVAIQYNDVKLSVKMADLKDCVQPQYVNNCTSIVNDSDGDVTVNVEYIFLTHDERVRFAQTQHEYIMTQTQHDEREVETKTNVLFDIRFNHPVSELVWCIYKIGSGGSAIDKLSFGGQEDQVQPCGLCVGCIQSDDVDIEACIDEVSAYIEKNNASDSVVDLVSKTPMTKNLLNLCMVIAKDTVDKKKSLMMRKTGLFTEKILVRSDSSYVISSDKNADDLLDALTEFLLADTNHLLGITGIRCIQPIVKKVNFEVLDDVSFSMNNTLKLSGRHGSYFNTVTPYYYHNNTPERGIYCLPFALDPDDLQPSGAVNFSRLDNATFSFTIKKGPSGNNEKYKIHVFGKNYNVLRITGGMAGPQFA